MTKNKVLLNSFKQIKIFSTNFLPLIYVLIIIMMRIPILTILLILKKKYELRLVASDNLNENYTTIVIHVNDVNDNPPVFDRPTYETQITEEDDRSLPKRVLQVKKGSKQNFLIFSIYFYRVHPPLFDDIYYLYLLFSFCSFVIFLFIFFRSV
jgi:multisubunit Na+/H+ antiporter MnhF subunit